MLRAGREGDLLHRGRRRARELRVPVIADEAWAELRSRLRAFIARRVRDPGAQDDLVQDVLLRLHAGLGGLRDADRLDAFGYAVARNAIADHFRRGGRDRPVDPEGLEGHRRGPGEGGADEEGADEGGAGRAELARCLRPLVDRLDEPYRQALLLTDLGDLSQAEAARRLGLSSPGMKSRVQRGRAQVRRSLSECCAVALDAAHQIGAVERIGPCACG